MNSFQAIILGLVQGLTEFLPISSSAHLILTPYLFKWEDLGLTYDVALHMGTLTALILCFWKDWILLLKKFLKLPLNEREQQTPSTDIKWIVLGCVPAVLAGVLFEKAAEETFRSPLLIAVTLSVFGFLLMYFDKNGKKAKDLDGFGAKEALIVGIAQAMAIVPGVSRSGITITAALLLGFTRLASMRFSFLLSAPIIAGAGLMKTKALLNGMHDPDFAKYVAVGFTSSLISGLLAIYLLNYLVKNKSLKGFAYYRFALSLLIVGVIFFR